MTTKRPERISQCVPSDWGDGWDHVHIGKYLDTGLIKCVNVGGEMEKILENGT